MVSGGDDCKVKFWDYRKPDRPLKVLSSHSHWYVLSLSLSLFYHVSSLIHVPPYHVMMYVILSPRVWNVQYNYFHDQLVVSSSTDSIVNLWNVASLSSAPLGEMAEEEG
eukprot:TRINITY_DN2311_c0_g1_i3.p1 TRINITY_DN2311_c0_g1~~TRINITY_DN2311_c0_g1_i3.p1  ORF type:complete len:109 (-),score=16.15 TRINITY_DN2311_c0_g1_i3:53-379(-)